MIRFFKPHRLIEIGCGNSTLIEQIAIRKNMEESKEYRCEVTCIEPYEQSWLSEVKNLKVIRKRVEDVNLSLFMELEKNDILFIDSSHVIRPQGDVLFEIQEILPALNTGVLIHFHDILTPRDYPERWMIDEVRLWNEQYLLEAFLQYNNKFEILVASNYLKHHYWNELAAKCPVLREEKESEPGSFWIRKK